MGLFDNFKKVDVRSLENPNIPVSADNFLHLMGWGDFNSSSGVVVNVESALGVPAILGCGKLYKRHFSEFTFGSYAAHTERHRARN